MTYLVGIHQCAARILEKGVRIARPAARSRFTLGVPVAIAHRSSAAVNAAPRAAARQRVAVPARLTWKDSVGRGAIRLGHDPRHQRRPGRSSSARAQAPIPLFRLVHLQLEDDQPAGAGPASTARGRLAAVWRVESPKSRSARRAATRCASWSSRRGRGRSAADADFAEPRWRSPARSRCHAPGARLALAPVARQTQPQLPERRRRLPSPRPRLRAHALARRPAATAPRRRFASRRRRRR